MVRSLACLQSTETAVHLIFRGEIHFPRPFEGERILGLESQNQASRSGEYEEEWY